MKIFDFETTDYDSLTISQLKRIADYWARQYLLSKAKRKGMSGYVYCPLKNTWYPEHKMQVAHFIDRGIMSTRYDLDNINLISEQSNVWDAQIPKEGYKSKHHHDYEKSLGPKIVEKLRKKAEELILMNKEDYIKIIEKFRE